MASMIKLKFQKNIFLYHLNNLSDQIWAKSEYFEKST